MIGNSKTIKLVVNREDLQDFYSSQAKIIIAECDQIYFNQTINTNHKITIYSFQYDQNLQTGTIKNLDNKVDLDLVKIQLMPTSCLGLLALTPEGKVALDKFHRWCSNTGNSQFIPSFIELDQEQEPAKIQADFWQQIFQRSQQDTQAIVRRNATLHKQYLNLRTLHENMQNAFAAVEEYLSQAKLPELQLAFDNQPIQKWIQPGNATQSNSLTVKQLLPVSSRGLAVVKIQLARTDKNAIGQVIIQLKYCENKTSFTKWQIPYEEISGGWLSLDLPHIDIGRKRDVELIIDWNTQSGTAPSLAVGKKQLIPELRAYCNENTIDHSLAFRVWQGLPGSRKVTNPYLEAESESQDIKLGFLGQGILSGVKELTAQANDNFAHVQVIDGGGKIMTHPRVDGSPTIAILPYTFSAQANYLTTTVITEHDRADTMEYSLAIVSKDRVSGNQMSVDSALAHSGWIAVEPNTERQISLYLDNPPIVNSHIVLAAKLAANSKSDCAWCRWLNFKLDWRSQNPQEKPAESLRNVSLDASTEAFPRVLQLNDQGTIQVHPFMGIDTVAILANAVPSNTAKVKAIVCTPNEQASELEYAMAIIEHDDDAQARLAVTNPTETLGFSGWHRVGANIPYRLNLELLHETSSQCHLVLATRIPEGGMQSHAWARWLDIVYVAAEVSRGVEMIKG